MAIIKAAGRTIHPLRTGITSAPEPFAVTTNPSLRLVRIQYARDIKNFINTSGRSFLISDR
jgi:hypothetical protein